MAGERGWPGLCLPPSPASGPQAICSSCWIPTERPFSSVPVSAPLPGPGLSRWPTRHPPQSSGAPRPSCTWGQWGLPFFGRSAQPPIPGPAPLPHWVSVARPGALPTSPQPHPCWPQPQIPTGLSRGSTQEAPAVCLRPHSSSEDQPAWDRVPREFTASQSTGESGWLGWEGRNATPWAPDPQILTQEA